jgi:hypothetical protein
MTMVCVSAQGDGKSLKSRSMDDEGREAKSDFHPLPSFEVPKDYDSFRSSSIENAVNLEIAEVLLDQYPSLVEWI